MNSKNELIKQNNLAFDFIEKLYLESSYLVKELAGNLNEEEENFLIGKPGGYGITTSTSKGLEPNNVKSWLLRKFSVFFVAEESTELKGGVTVTRIDNDLKVLYLRIIFYDKNIKYPTIFSGALYGIERKNNGSWIKKFEQIMGHIEYNDDKFFRDINRIKYEDRYIKVQGELIQNNLFDINDSSTIVNKIVKPSLELYRKH
jgi:hypothetical protein